MDIKNKPTLAEKQAFWAEQLPNFEAKYWLPSHFELLEFDMEGGNYEVRDVLPEHYSEDDASDIYHRVNTGWAMWKKAINFTKAQTVPEQVLDAPACVGSSTFQKGVKWSTVIAAAQRHFKYTQNAKKAPSLDIDQVKKLVSGDFVLVEKQQLAQLMENMDSLGKKALGDNYVSFADIAVVLGEAQEPNND